MYEYSNNSERKLIVRFFSSIGFIATFSMASLAFINNSYLLAFTLVASSFVYLLAFNIGRGVEKSATIILYNLYALMFYLVLTGGAQGTGPIWIFIVSPVTYSIRGLKRGTYDIVLFLSAIVLGFYCADTFNIYDYNPEQFPVRIILAFIIVASLSGYYEFSREKYSSKLIALSQKNEFLATIDPLTNLPNRRFTMNKLIVFKNELKNNNIPFVILLADVDNFNAIASRWGGEEFLIVIPDATVEQGELVAEKIHNALESSAVSLFSDSVNITLSIGITAANAERSIDLDIKHADELLYKAKEQGKNRTCSF